MQYQIISNSLNKIVIIENAKLILRVTVISQSDFSNKVEDQTKSVHHIRWMKELAQAERYTIKTFTDLTGMYKLIYK